MLAYTLAESVEAICHYGADSEEIVGRSEASSWYVALVFQLTSWSQAWGQTSMFRQRFGEAIAFNTGLSMKFVPCTELDHSPPRAANLAP